MIALLGSGLHKGGWEPILQHLNSEGLDYQLLDDHSQLSSKFLVAFSFGYNKMVRTEYLELLAHGLLVFHSSDLPKGRGWAPIFYTLKNQEPNFVVSLIQADEGVDTGAIVAKAIYPIDRLSTHGELREIDDQLVMILFRQFASLAARSNLKGKPQPPSSFAYCERRTPAQSRVEPKQSVADLWEIARCLPPEHPAFLELEDGAKVEFTVFNTREFHFDRRLVSIVDNTA